MDFKIGDKVIYSIYTIKCRWPLPDEIVHKEDFKGTIIELCGLHSEIGIPQAKVKIADVNAEMYIPLEDLIKI